MVFGLNGSFPNFSFLGKPQGLPANGITNSNGSIFDIGFIPTPGLGPNPALDNLYRQIDQFLYNFRAGNYPPTSNPYTGEQLTQNTQQNNYDTHTQPTYNTLSGKTGPTGLPAGYKVLAENNFDSGYINKGWKKHSNADGITLVDDPTGSGNKVMKASINKNDNFSGITSGKPRAEITNGGVRFQEGKEYMITFKTLIPKDYEFDTKKNREGIVQIHKGSDYGAGGPFSIGLEGNEYQSWTGFEGEENNSRVDKLGNAEKDKGKWVTWTLHYKPSSTGKDGIYELSKDGKEIVNKNGKQNMFKGDNQGYFKIGLYKWNFNSRPSDVTNRTIYYDDIKIGEKE